MKYIAASVLLCLATVSAHAAPDAQWKDQSTTLATLVQSGYRLVAVDHAPSPNTPGVLTTVYYVQKDTSMAACSEAHRVVDAKKGTKTAEFTCSELVQPYDSASPEAR